MNHEGSPVPSPGLDATRAGSKLRTLSILHACNGPYSLVGGGAFITVGLMLFKMSLHFTTNPNPEEAAPPPEWAFAVVKWGIVGSFLILHGIGCVLNLASAFLLRSHKWRAFSLATSLLNCLQLPFGTMLGVYTIKVLRQPDVLALYARHPSPAT